MMVIFGGDVSLVPTIEDVKQWLSRFAENERQLDNLIERVGLLRSRLESPRAATISGMPHSGGCEGDPIGRTLGQIEKLEEIGQDQLRKSRRLYAEINTAIDRITRRAWPDLRAVLKMRYLDLANWSEINFMLWGEKSDFNNHEETYLRRTYRLHAEALEAMLNIVPNFRGTENNTESEETVNE